MARPREFEINDALEKAMEAFWAKGYDATSMVDLMKVMNLNKGSIYAAFGNKHALFTKALTQYTDTTYARIKNIFSSTEAPNEAIKIFFDKMLVEQSIPTDKVKTGTLMVNSIIELAPHDESAKIILNRQVKRLEAIFSKAIGKGQETGVFRNDTNAKDLAIEVSVFIFGIMSYRKTGCDIAKIQSITDNYLKSLTA
jgi:TetR/AcrR family transcriptional repressor of nem operon